jgi:hypothetical protein
VTTAGEFPINLAFLRPRDNKNDPANMTDKRHVKIITNFFIVYLFAPKQYSLGPGLLGQLRALYSIIRHVLQATQEWVIIWFVERHWKTRP